jgi:hypothetical protein
MKIPAPRQVHGKHHLFTITVYIAEQKLKIHGDYKDLWGKNEFSKLKSFANELRLSSELNAETISSLYTTTFQDTSDVYVGQTENLRKRVTLHKEQIRHEEYRHLKVSEQLNMCNNGIFKIMPIYQCINTDRLFREMKEK